MEVKMKKVCMFLVLCLVAMGVYGHNEAELNDFTQINFMAKGLDEDIPGIIVPLSPVTAENLVVGKIEFDEVTGQLLGQVEFHVTIHDLSGAKVYSMKGHLENGMVVPPGFMSRYCEVRNVTWINFWFVMGSGRIKTTEAITINYRGSTITLPNTEGKYVPATIVMMVSPYGEYEGGYWEAGWAWAGLMTSPTTSFGGITYLTKYVEN
jgi:hypothetical protein